MLFVIVFVTDYTLLTSGISLCDKKSEKKVMDRSIFLLTSLFFSIEMQEKCFLNFEN